jgi:gluconate 5-dehydrogenase
VSGLFDLTRRLALVTGSSRGIGRAIAAGLGRHGARVVLNGRNEQRLAAAVDAMKADGLDARGRAFDVTDGRQVEAAVASIEAEAGPIDVLVNNAGIQDRAPLLEMAERQWRRVLEANLTSAFLVGRTVARGMVARRRGKVINICSLMSEVHRPTVANYAAAKGGLKMLTRAMCVEWAAGNVQANGIAPGYIQTDLTAPLVADPQFNAWICQRTPAGRWGRPEDLIGAAVFLASDASDYVNGQIIYVDGGILAGL